MKKLLSFLILILTLTLSLSVFTACGDNGDNVGGVDNPPAHIHDYGIWVSNGNGTHTKTCAYDAAHTETLNCFGGVATCTKKAKCAICGDSYGELKLHDYKEILTEPKCEQKGYTTYTCTVCSDSYVDNYVDALNHYYINDTCKNCQDKIDITGLTFTLINNDTEYSVTDYTGTNIDVCIPNVYNGKFVTSIGRVAFGDCISLESVEIPDSVINIGMGAFASCSYLKTVTFGENSQLTSIGLQAFYGCTSLESIEFPSSVTSIGIWTFSNCTSLQSVVIPSGVISIGADEFYGCTSLESIVVDSDNANYKSIDGVLYTKDGTILICYPAGKTNTSFEIPDSVTSIGDSAFEYCRKLTSIEIPDSVTSIGDSAFYNCISLKSIIIPNSVTSISNGAFSSCDLLESIEIPSSVTSIGIGAFSGCDSLESIEIPSSVTSIGYGAFEACEKLTSITFKDTTTWYRIRFNDDNAEENWQNKTGGTKTDLTTPTSNAFNFKKTIYIEYYLYKI